MTRFDCTVVWRDATRLSVMATALLLFVWVAGPEPACGAARSAEAPVLDTVLVESVIGTALNFLGPRTLDPYSNREFALWGLGGLTAIDPSLTVESDGDQLRLVTPQAVLYVQKAPADTDLAGWTRAAVATASAAWNGSGQIRGAGQQALIQSFFDELFNHLDPYSRYIAPAPASTDRSQREGAEASAGMTVARQGRPTVARQGRPTVNRQGRSDLMRSPLISAVNANGPAWQAGISAGMRLLAVDGKSTRNQDDAVVNAWLQGADGSNVSLRLGAGHGHTEEQTITLMRARVPPETVFAFSSGNIVVLRITGFSADTAQELSQFLDQAMQPESGKPSRVQGLIFDLRGNRGGLLQQAVTSVALVLDHGVAVITRGRNRQSNHIWSVQGGDLTGGLPIVVLVDGRTASAAEIMAASLADHRRAVVVGSATLGKGLVQTIAQLPDGGELFVTWSRVLAPLGWPLQGLGVMPQLCTSVGQSALDRALADLSLGINDSIAAVRQSRRSRAPMPVASILDIRNACPAAIGTDADLDAARLLIEDGTRYNAALVPEDVAEAAANP